MRGRIRPGAILRITTFLLSMMLGWPIAGVPALAQSQALDQASAQRQDQAAEAAPSRQVREDLSQAMEIPSVIAMEASPLHLYVLSESDGLVVFRPSGDSLNWLYSSTGMQRRGQRLQVDARFAYLTGYGNRITVIEPTSVLGVYSSTSLPSTPRSAARTGTILWIAMGSSGLGAVSLESPESVDAGVRQPFASRLGGHRILDVASDPSSTLFILSETAADQRRWLHTVRLADPDSAVYVDAQPVGTGMMRLHLADGRLFGSTDEGELLKVVSGGEPEFVAGFGSALDAVHPTYADDGSYIIRTRGGKLWIGSESDGFDLIRSESGAGNHIGVSHHGIHISQYGRISRVIVTPASAMDAGSPDIGAHDTGGDVVLESGRATYVPAEASGRTSAPGRLKLLRIENQQVPAQRPLIVPIGFEDDPLGGQIDLSIISNTPDAMLRGRSFHWQPSSSQAGVHTFTILATSATGQRDTVSFDVKVDPFNLPPRFAPVRPLTLPAGTPFETFFSAIDPDGMSRDLVRYLGIDLPAGSALDERTGRFSWTPGTGQTGGHSFRIVGTDAWGSAASVDVSIQVIAQE